MERIFGQNKVRVNSLHHQALRTIGTDLVVAASSPDGVVEAVENPRLTFAVGVQWHPESMFETDELTQKLFQELITKSKEWAEGRARK